MWQVRVTVACDDPAQFPRGGEGVLARCTVLEQAFCDPISHTCHLPCIAAWPSCPFTSTERVLIRTVCRHRE